MFELLHLGSCSSGHVEWTSLDDSVFKYPKNSPILVQGHFVIANRLFLILWSSGGKVSIACFDPAAGSDELGEWINIRINSGDIRESFRPFRGIPFSIKCVSVRGVDDDHGDVDGIGSGLHIIQFSVAYPYQNPLYFAGVCTEYGILLCYQDITEEIFNERMVPEYMGNCTCNFADMGGGRVYAVASGLSGDDSNHVSHIVLCVSDFVICKGVTLIRLIISQVLVPSVIHPAKEAKFVDIVCVTNYICEIPMDKVPVVTGAFFF